MDEEVNMESTPIQRFKRFLHLTTEENYHQPGCKFFAKHFVSEKVRCFNELMEQEDTSIIIDTIKKVHLEKTSPFPEAIIFALTLCCKQTKDLKLRQKGYELADTVCITNEDFFLFFKFAFESPPKLTAGGLCKKFIRRWYFNRTPLELAAVLSDVRRFKNWGHIDVFRIGHVHSKNPSKAPLVAYVRRGFDYMKENYGNVPEAEEVIQHLDVVENFRKNTNEEAVKNLIEQYMLSINYVHYTLTYNKVVWTALLRDMPLKTLLDRFHILSENRLFRNGLAYDFTFMNLVADALGKQSSIVASGIHPLRAFIEHFRLENEAKSKIDLAVKLKNTPAKKPPSVHRVLITAFEKLTLDLFKNVKPTNKRFLVGLQTAEDLNNKCWRCRYISVGLAVSFVAFCLLKKEEHVTFIMLNEKTKLVEKVELTKDMFYQDIRRTIDDLGKNNKAVIKIDEMVNWASEKQYEFDVCISLGANYKRRIEDKLTFKGFRLIMCNFGCRPKVNACTSPECLSLYGLDDKVCTLISSFASGAF